MIGTATNALPSLGEGAHDQPIRVAHVAGFSETSASGVDRTVAGLVRHLARCGVQPEVWHLSPGHASVKERRAGSVRVVELPAHRRARSALVGLPEATRRFVDERRDGIDVLHLHSVFIPDNVWVARVARRPYVLTPNGGYAPEILRGRNRVAKMVWMRWRERDYVRAASLVHSVSPREVEQLQATFGVDTLMFAPNAIDLPAESVSPQHRMGLSPKLVVFLGRLAVDHKGLDVLLEGYARYLKSSGDSGSELVIAGPDFRSGRAKLLQMAGSQLPSGRVRLPGPLFGEDKDALLRSAYVFVHTSRWEGMPYAVLEALATGCPVLLTSATNLGEFVERSGAGVVVDGTPEGVREGLTTILTASADRYGAMCEASLRLASQRFTWSVVAEQVAGAYRAILV